MDKFEALEKSMCKELEAIEQKIKGGAEMSTADLDKVDKLTHAMKSLATYKAMKEAEEYDYGEGDMSGRRGRAMNGRYVSRDGGSSYADGYSRGYSEAMSQQSGHYSTVYPESPYGGLRGR